MNGQMENEKIIEEMAEEINMAFEDVQSNCDCGDCIDCEYYHIEGRIGCKSYGMAKNLYNLYGWRKERQGEWISVEDRLPKNNLARVLVFLKDAEFTRLIGFNKIDTDRCIDGKWARWGEYVTHWQPLPQPPKMKGAK